MLCCVLVRKPSFFNEKLRNSKVLRVELGRGWFRNRNCRVETPPLFFRHFHTNRISYGSSAFDSYCLHDYVISNSDGNTGSLRLIHKRNLTVTAVAESGPVIKYKDTDVHEGKFLTNAILQQLKKGSVEDAARTFFDHCHRQEDDIDFHTELIAILENLHDNPQTSETFAKKILELASCSNIDNNHEGILKEEETFQPLRDHYQIVLNAWLNFDPPGVKRAQALLDYMEVNAHMPYDTQMCNCVLKSWAKKGNAGRAQDLFNKMIQKRTPVDLPSYLCVFEAWSRSKSPHAARRAEKLLLRMESSKFLKPNARCYLYVIECWVKSKRKGFEDKIESLVSRLNQCLENKTHNSDNDTNRNIRQNALSYLLQAYHSIGNAHRAEELLLAFVKDSQNNTEYPSPTIGMCISVLSTWSKSKSSRRAERAEKFLNLMENTVMFPQPDTACYTAVLKCIAVSRKEGSAKKAEALLRRMDRTIQTQSNMLSLTCVIIAWARSEDPQAPIRAELIFQEILDRGMQPDRYVFAGLITAWGRSEDRDSIQKVEKYFEQLKCSQKSRPTVVEYTAVIQAYANYVSNNVEKSREAVGRAEFLLTEMLASEDENLRPNILSYAAALKTIAAARRISDRGERAEKILKKMILNKTDITPYITNLVKKCNNHIHMQK